MVSYARNREDVVLWRALHEVRLGRFVEVVSDPVGQYSTTRALAEQGWSGVVISATSEWQDTVADGDAAALHVLAVSADAASLELLPQLLQARPWLIVVSSTSAPDPADVPPGQRVLRDHAYSPALFDGVSWFYVSDEHLADLAPALAYPACPWDAFSEAFDPVPERSRDVARDEVTAEILRWRRAALSSWASSAAEKRGPADVSEMRRLRAELEETRRDAAALRQTLSWRVTVPLRMVRQLGRRA